MQVIRGCWQLGGEHGGDPASDHTSGPQAIEDLDRFVRAGVTSLDTAPIYGPAEALVGQYLRLQPDRRPQLQV